MRSAFLGLVFLAACASTDPSPPPQLAPPSESPDDRLSPQEKELGAKDAARAAEELIERRESPGSLDHAVLLLRHALARTPDSAELRTLLAEAHARLADASDLKTPTGRRDHELHRTAAAEEARQALRLEPDRGPSHYWLGFTFLVMADGEQSYGRLKQALEELRKADQLSPTVDEAGPARMIARIYQETPGFPLLGSKPQAVKYYRRALELAPGSILSRLWLGETYVALKKPELAHPELVLVKAAKDRPGHEKEDASLRSQAERLLQELPMK